MQGVTRLVLLLSYIGQIYSLSSPLLTQLSKRICSKDGALESPVQVQLLHPDRYTDDDDSSVLLLVDLGVRQASDLGSLAQLHPFLPRLLGKVSASVSLSDDKFLATADVGDQTVRHVSIARIPVEMYQKLDLARRLVDSAASRTRTVVHMVSDLGATAVDRDMTVALVAAMQAKAFPMPSMKKADTVTTEQATYNLTFICEETEEPQTDTSNNVDDGSIGKSLSGLELAMLEASRARTAPAVLRPLPSGLDLLATIAQQRVLNEAHNLARALAAAPPNVLTPASYAAFVRTLACAMDVQYEEFLVDELAGMGCGAIAAVTQGNAKGSDRLVKLTYRGRQSKTQGQGGGVTKSATLGQLYTSTLASTKESLRPVVLVGKGVCYDTGGVNVKSASSMKTMKHDMAGSAAALGVFAALSSTGCVTPVECWLVLAENNINGESYRPDDVVTALSGDTIEVVHSDAEGRMLLADVLAAASRKVPSRLTPDDGLVPRLVVDFATLTGTCITSLSNKYVGALSNRKEYASTVIAAGEKCGERVWPFPCDEDFDEDLKSDVADVLQCRQTTEADHIYAFAFLRRFVRPGVPWIHLDLGSAYRPGGLGHVPSDYTGAGVRLGWQLVHDITTTGEKDRSDF